MEGLFDSAARFEPVGQEVALSKLGDGQGEVAHLGRLHPLQVTVAVGRPFVRAALMGLGTNGSDHPCFQQALEAPAHDPRDHRRQRWCPT